MSDFDKFQQQLYLRLAAIMVTGNLLLLLGWSFLNQRPPALDLNLLLSAGLAVFAGLLLAWLVTRTATRPTAALWQAILHVSYEQSNLPAPNVNELRAGKELIGKLVQQIYQLASQADRQANGGSSPADQAQRLLDSVPLPVIAVGSDRQVVYANPAAANYSGVSREHIIGMDMYAVLNMSFPSEDTFDVWLKDCQANKATDSHIWRRVRMDAAETKSVRQFDMAALYSKDNPAGFETVVALFDQSALYEADDQGLSYVALAVHELRTPLTLLRGYIEVFDDEFSKQLDPELQGFMQKMQASAQQLTSFVNNILNVARVEENQLALHLSEGEWPQVLSGALDDMRLRAEVHNKQIEVAIADGLPTVAVDRVSIYEVVYNLIDNAIKYSGAQPMKIIVKSYLTKDGLVETTVQDFGVGIPASVVPSLFDKFRRNHRNRTQIGGTGLGLYLSKSIINAHGGNIWVRSREGEGSTFGFTLQPYAAVAEQLKNNDNSFVREAHGWIKNHSMYRR